MRNTLYLTETLSVENAFDLMGKGQLREFAVALTDKVKNNASTDWQIKESVRAKILELWSTGVTSKEGFKTLE